jgi:uncharacterized protein YjbI with pentapeptide repeats
MKKEELLNILKAWWKSWNAWRSDNPLLIPDLSWAYLEGVDLAGADLKGTKLSGADLEDADLRQADLSGANVNDKVGRTG